VIRRLWHEAAKLLSSARTATWLLAVLGVWSGVATLIPQGDATTKTVASWAAANPVIELPVRLLGLHQAFSSVVFTLLVVALGLCTAVCAWRRTRAATRRAHALSEAAASNESFVAARHDLEIVCRPGLVPSEVISAASDALKPLGVRAKRRGNLLSEVSPVWSVWGSPVFHWGLLIILLALLFGGLQRSEGMMQVPVGQAKADAPASYESIHFGPLRDWRVVQRSIRVDGFSPNLRTGGIDRGPTPVVTVLDSAGAVLKTQEVYPNRPLQIGSLTIHPSDYGLVAGVSRISSAGVETGRAYALIDFSQNATDGTVPAAGYLSLSDASGKPEFKVFITVLLPGKPGQFLQDLPADPMARIVVTRLDGTAVIQRIVAPGQNVPLPTGGSLHLGYLGYSAQIVVVDDSSVPFLYVGLFVSLVGLAITVFSRQQIFLAVPMEGPDGVKIAVTVRMWRNASSSRSEIEAELARALGGPEQGSTT
jgi:cytochrome c biogenesis protein ResB